MTTGYDALGHPSPEAVGKGHFVGQYLKNLTRAQVDSYHNAGVTVVLIWESTGHNSLAGYNQGLADGHTAASMAANLGAPTTAAIYFAEDDFDVSPTQAPAVVAYMQGVKAVLGPRTGFYGGLRAVEAVANAQAASYLFQTYAWSGGKWDPRDSLEQYLNGQTLAGTGVDFDKAVRAAYGGWTPPSIPAPPAPKPTPEPKPPVIKDDEMSVLFVNSKGIDGRPATAAWADAGTARRHVSAAEFQARESAGEKVSIVDLNPADPFWVLPVVGGA